MANREEGQPVKVSGLFFTRFPCGNDVALKLVKTALDSFPRSGYYIHNGYIRNEYTLERMGKI